jgi:hypothetical protein
MTDKEIETILSRLARMEEKLENIHGEVKSTKKILDGNGNPEAGLVYRVVRMETKGKLLFWGLGVIGAAVLGYVGISIVKLFQLVPALIMLL